MALVIGHSQAKYLSQHLCPGSYSVFAYPGAKVLDFLDKDCVYEVAEYFSTVVLIIGANDVGSKSPEKIAEEIGFVVEKIHHHSPSATVLISEILPRGQNFFPDCAMSQHLLTGWNHEADEVNKLLHLTASNGSWLKVLQQPDFITLIGANRQLLGRDGLHLNRGGNRKLASNIEEVVNMVSRIQSPPEPVPVVSQQELSPANCVRPLRYSDAVTNSTPSVEPTSSSSMSTRPPVTSTLASSSTTSANSTPTQPTSSSKPTGSTSSRTTSSSKSVSRQSSLKCTASRSTRTTTTSKSTSQTSTRTTLSSPKSAASASSQPRSSSTLLRSASKLSAGSRFRVLPMFKCKDITHSNELSQLTEKRKQRKQKKKCKTSSAEEMIDNKPGCQSGGGETVEIEEQNPAGIGENEESHISDSVKSNTCTMKVNDSVNESKVYKTVEDSDKFSFVDALKIIINIDESRVTEIPPYQPDNGYVYVFLNSDSYKADGFTWRYTAKKEQTVSGISILKMYYHIRNGKEKSSRFCKDVYKISLKNDKEYFIVHYKGDKSEFKNMPHGNSKSDNAKPYKRTLPSVLRDIKSRQNENPTQVFNKMRSEQRIPRQYDGILIPKSSSQIKYLQAKARQQNRLSHDSLYNLHELFYHLDGYISEVKTLPDLHIIVGNIEIQKEFERLIQLKGDETVTLYYDTTFNCGDFYISILSFQHFLFEGSPIIPLSFCLHERKFQTVHTNHLKVVQRQIPKLDGKKINIVTDRETGIINSIKEVFPELNLLICWNHILKDVDFWLKKMKANEDLKVYKNDVRTLLESSSEEEFFSTYEDKSIKWSKGFLEYFDTNLKDVINKHAGRWVLEKLDIYNSYSGITNNACESLNAKLKRLIDWKEREIDTTILFLYYWQTNDLNDIISGFCNAGNLNLRKKFKHLLKNPEDVDIPINTCHPDNLIQTIKTHIANTQADNASDTEINLQKQTELQTLNTVSDQPKSINPKSSSQFAMADRIISDNAITLVPEMKCFIVKGTNDKKYAVTLFPKETCQCPSTGRCYHIISALLSVGLEADDQKPKIHNLTQLRKNSRKKNQKKCGRKQPRVGDLDEMIINAAPDSILMQSLQEQDFNADSIASCSTPKSEGKLLCKTSTPKSAQGKSETPKSILKRKHESSGSSSPRKSLRFADISFQNNVEDFFIEDQNSSRNSENECIQDFVSSLKLTEVDKKVLICNEKLNSNHMEAVNTILQKQFPNVKGLQLTEKVPKFIDDEGRWHIGTVMSSVSGPSAQIHHTHHDHWVVSLQDENDTIFLIDSLGVERHEDTIISNGLKIQLSLCYGKNKHKLEIIVPETQRQMNGVDCGLFAIAHLTSFCFSGKVNTSLIFDTVQFRKHLQDCFEKMSMSEFPQTLKRLNSRKKKQDKIITIENFCVCSLPECVDDMVMCDICEGWFHKYCMKTPCDISYADSVFYCTKCS